MPRLCVLLLPSGPRPGCNIARPPLPTSWLLLQKLTEVMRELAGDFTSVAKPQALGKGKITRLSRAGSAAGAGVAGASAAGVPDEPDPLAEQARRLAGVAAAPDNKLASQSSSLHFSRRPRAACAASPR